jgi:hypothetical protein
LFVALSLLALAFLIWFVWMRPIQSEASIDSFEACVRAGNPIQESYPEVCLTKSGKRFVNLAQSQAHQKSLTNSDELVPPTNPALLNLDVDEWKVRIPLTIDTFDLSYSYLEDGGSESLTFTYKRLVALEACKSGIGLTLTRSTVQHTPPFSPSNPAPLAQASNYYYYASTAGSPCYDPGNAQQAAVVKAITGDQSLTQATAGLLAKLQTLPPGQ